MTLLAARRVPNGVVVLGDGVVGNVGTLPERTEEGRTQMMVVRNEARKIHQVQNNPNVVWGFAGDDTPGQMFGDWLDGIAKEVWSSMTWAALTAAARSETYRINVEVVAKQAEPCDLLVAGILQGETNALHVDRLCREHRMDHYPQKFVGDTPLLDIQAETSWNTARRFIEILFPDDPTETFRAFFEAHVETAGFLNPPVSGWVLTTDGPPIAIGDID